MQSDPFTWERPRVRRSVSAASRVIRQPLFSASAVDNSNRDVSIAAGREDERGVEHDRGECSRVVVLSSSSALPSSHFNVNKGIKHEGTATDEDRVHMLEEEIDRLHDNISFLKADLAEKEWAVKRAAELGHALHALTEENFALKKNLSDLKSSAAEVEGLRRAQEILIRALDGSEGKLSSTHVNSLLETAKLSCEELQRKCSVIASWGPSVCPACLATKEERQRGELQLRERSSWQQLMTCWDALFAAQRYCTVQYSEMEQERMWAEDMLSHRLSMMHLQAELKRKDNALQVMLHHEQDAVVWKNKFKQLKENIGQRVVAMKEGHEMELRECRRLSSRASPSTSLMKSLFVSNVKTHYGHGKLMFALAVLRKQLLLLLSEAAAMKRFVIGELGAVEQLCTVSLKRCMPVEWKEVPSSVPSVLRKEAHPPQLSTYARNAIVPQKRSSSAPKIESRR